MFHKIMGNLGKNAGNRGHNIIFFPYYFNCRAKKGHKNPTGGKYIIFFPPVGGKMEIESYNVS